MEAVAFGVMHVDENRRVTGFVEKPADPPAMPGKPGHRAREHGHLRVQREVSVRSCSRRTSRASNTDHDFGKDILPRVVTTRHGDRASVRHVVRDVGHRPEAPPTGATSARSTPTGPRTSTSPRRSRTLDLYDRNWPIWTNQEQLPPAKFVRDLKGLQGAITNLLVCGGCVISGSQVSKLGVVVDGAGAFVL